MTEEKIILDRKSFEALAVESRVRLLKSLKQRRKTLTEMSQEQEMSASAVKEHLENLESAGLIRKIDDGHKWKYYELTQKGSDIVTPKELRVWVLLSISMVALLSSMLAIFYATGGAVAEAPVPEDLATPPELDGAPDMAEAQPLMATGFENESQGMPKVTYVAESYSERTETPDITVPSAVALISILVIIGCSAVLVRNRTRATA